MKSTGIVRKLDALGRIVIPIELLRVMDIQEGEALEFYYDLTRKQIMMKAYLGTACLFCKSAGDDMSYFKGKLICQSCLVEIDSGVPLSSEAPLTALTENESVIVPQSAPKRIDRENKQGTKRFKKEEMLTRLLQARNEHPNMNQTNLARVLGVTAPYVNILIKELRERGVWDKHILKVE